MYSEVINIELDADARQNIIVFSLRRLINNLVLCLALLLMILLVLIMTVYRIE